MSEQSEKSEETEPKFVTISELQGMVSRFPDDAPVGAMRGVVLLVCDHIAAIEEVLFNKRTGLVPVSAGIVKRTDRITRILHEMAKAGAASAEGEQAASGAAPAREEPEQEEGIVPPNVPSRVTPAVPPPSAGGPAKPPVVVVSQAVPGQPPAPPTPGK